MLVRVDPRTPDPGAIARAVQVLRAGRIVAYCTDTLYGLAVDPRNASAVAALFAAKGRAEHQAVPLIAADRAQVARLGEMNLSASRLADRFWPGPLTLVLTAIAPLADGVAAPDGTVAVRIPDHAAARALASAFGYPLTATSANRSGELPAQTAAAAMAALGDALGLALDSGPAPGAAPSTIVDARGRVPRLIRGGPIAWDRVLESLK
jgi:L-threonylcarbamoyladenylate synthase